MKLNIRNKLIIFAVLAIIIPLGISAVIILVQLTSFTSQRSTERIMSDARVAKSVFAKRQENLRAAAQSLAVSIASGRGAVKTATPPAAGGAGAPAAAAAQPAAAAAPAAAGGTSDVLKRQLEASKLSFAVYLDAKGKVVAQHNGPAVGDGGYFSSNPLFVDVTNAAQQGKPEALSGAALEGAAMLEGVALTKRAEVAGVDSGLFLEAAAPVLSGDTVQGVVVIGQLVNNDVAVENANQQSIVNEIKEVVYRDMRDEAAVVIATTKDNTNTIVSTNLPSSDKGGVATGTAVTDAGGTFEKPSYNEQEFGGAGRYVTSFVPIEGVASKEGTKTIGKIGVAIKEDWFTAIVRRVQLTILIVTLVALVLAVGGAVFGAQRMTRPIVELTEAANRISLGELDAPIAVQAQDEIGTLAESLDRMRISLKQAIERLRKR